MAMMSFNGRFLPEIPIDSHPDYTYWVIMHTSETKYFLHMFNEPTSLLTVSGYTSITPERYTYTFTRGTKNTDWIPENNGELITENIILDKNYGYNYGYNKVFWTNHDIVDGNYSWEIWYYKGDDPIPEDVCKAEPPITLKDGTILPGLPSDVIAKYPYVVIFGPLKYYTDIGPSDYGHADTVYMFMANDVGYAFIPHGLAIRFFDVICGIKGTYKDNAVTFMFSVYGGIGTDYWCNDTCYSAPISSNNFNGNADYFQTIWGNKPTLCWSNHDIMVATNYNSDAVPAVTVGSEIYFYNSLVGAPKPERVSIGRSLVNSFADEVQRLTGITDQINAVQIKENLSTVKAGIKIGDVVLPPIPDDVLAEYPYVVIDEFIMGGTDPETGEYRTVTGYEAYASKSRFGIVPTGMGVWNPDDIRECYARIWSSKKSGKAMSIYPDGGETQWSVYDETEFGSPNVNYGEEIELNGKVIYMERNIIWSNHDLCIVTEVDYDNDIAGHFSSEVYYSERKNFNGVWLQKISEQGDDWYTMITHTTSTTGLDYYTLYKSNSPFFFIKGTADTEWVDKLVSKSQGYRNVVYDNGRYGSSWSALFPTADYSCGYIPRYDASVILIWSNHDIYEVASDNTSTNEYIAGDIYFPILPAIDNDRVSIDYKLFDGIVEEVQRLCYDPDQMNALQAYWKLTNVV